MAKNTMSLKMISKKMAGLDICMMTTADGRGTMTSRPMSNNGDVEYDGNSYFFTFKESDVVKELKANPQVNLSFKGTKDVYISVNGKAKLNRKRADMEMHWVKSLNKWFKQGIDTPGVVMVHVLGKTIRYWEKEKNGVIKL